jgi:hypothetical protein
MADKNLADYVQEIEAIANSPDIRKDKELAKSVCGALRQIQRRLADLEKQKRAA